VLGEHDGVQDEIGPNQDSNGALESGVQTMIWEELDPDGNFGPPNIVVGKIQWDADTDGEDIISVVRFLQEDELSEAAFDDLIDDLPPLSSANWESNKPDLEQSLFDTLNFSGTKYFLDEIRIGTTFADVAPPPGSGLPGDYNANGELDANDLDLQASEGIAKQNLAYDLNDDRVVDFEGDRVRWLHDLAKVPVGDADLNGSFTSDDFVTVFIGGLYETGLPAIWNQGDWNGDLVFDSNDFVAAFIDGYYEQQDPLRGNGGAAAVPEPNAVMLSLLGLIGLLRLTRRR
jgi:hypothetical protein